jgi:hypothetical protein
MNEIQNSKQGKYDKVLSIEICHFEFVSYFGFRASCFIVMSWANGAREVGLGWRGGSVLKALA